MKALFVILLSVLTPSIMFAQGMRVHTTDGKVADYPKSQLSFVDFYEAGESDKVNVPRLSSVTINGEVYYKFVWDEDEITKYYCKWEPLVETNIQHNSWTAIWEDESEQKTNTYSNIKRNSMGYITSFNYTRLYEKKENGKTSTYVIKGTYNFNYNQDGTLAAITSVVIEDDKYTESAYVQLTWKDGNLITIDYNSSNYSSEVTTFKYSNELNPYRQILYSQAYSIFDGIDDGLEFVRGLLMTGHFGLGSVNLPIEYEDYSVKKILVNTDKDRIISESIIYVKYADVDIISYEYE